MDKNMKLIGGAFAVIAFLGVGLWIIQNANSTKEEIFEHDFDAVRQAEIKKWQSYGASDVYKTLAEGQAVLDSPTVTISELKEAARKVNAAANYVGYIYDEYSNYSRSSLYAKAQVGSALSAYVSIGNKLQDVRNNAYIQIGDMLKDDRRITEAFFYYRDAYRLATFASREESSRYVAEQKMKEILGLHDIESYIPY